MAITVTTDMLYTRPGEGTPSDVLSAHDPIIWEFEESDGAIDSATVQFVVKDNLIAVIYTSAAFPAYLYDDSGPVLFRFDATQIIKHIINNYFYKETSDVIEPENYGSFIEVTIKTYDGVSLEDTEVLEYFASHALNQIGDEYGANIPRLFYNDTEEIAHFLGFPNHLFFYLATDLVAETPLTEILESSDNVILGWSNITYDTFTSSGATITSAITAVVASVSAWMNSIFSIEAGDVIIIEFALTLNSGTAPKLRIESTAGGTISNIVATSAGANRIKLIATDTKTDARILIFNDFAVGNWSTDEMIATKYEWYSEEGTLGIFMHDLNLGLFQLTKDTKIVNAKYDPASPNLIKTYNLTVFQPCENAVYIRFLTKDGYYMYWAFSPFPFTTKDQEQIGKVINSFTEMALANSRNHPIGYRDAFNRIAVAAASVPIAFRRKLMDLFTSPAVYLWQGEQTPDENLISSLINDGYETFIFSGTVITSAIETGVSGSARSDVFEIQQGDSLTVIFDLTLNSGAVPNLRISDATGIISNQVNATAGANVITLTATSGSLAAYVQFRNTAASNFSTGKIIVKRAEVELDWILLEAVEGSHNLREKKGADNFNATLVLPENYTQTLGGSDL